MDKNNKNKSYRNITCDSDEEVYFLMWAFELMEHGYIKRIERSPSFTLTEGWINEYEEQLKTKKKEKKQIILHPSVYTPDILLTFNESKYKKLVWLKPWQDKEKYESLFIGTNEARVNFILDQKDSSYPPNTQVFIEIKPQFDMHSMTRLFILNQKFMWSKYKIFVNLVKIPDLFASTFTPKEYMKTSGNKDRKIKFKITTCEEYLKQL